VFVSRGDNSIDKIVDFVKADMEFSPISSIVHWTLCGLIAVSTYVYLFGGSRFALWGTRRSLYGPTAEFVLDVARYAFPAMILLAIVGYVRDRNKSIAVKVMGLAAFCTFLCWWKSLL
jgi:hypothetical protein